MLSFLVPEPSPARFEALSPSINQREAPQGKEVSSSLLFFKQLFILNFIIDDFIIVIIVNLSL